MYTYSQSRNRLTDTENKLMVTKGERGKGRGGGILAVWGLTDTNYNT